MGIYQQLGRTSEEFGVMASDGPGLRVSPSEAIVTKYSLSADTFVCETADYPILLDLRRDRYLALQSSDAEVLREIVEDWPAPKRARIQGCSNQRRSELVNELETQGLITREKRRAETVGPMSIDTPATSLIDGYEPLDVSLNVSDVVRVARLVLGTRLLLRVAGLAKAVNRLRLTKERALQTHSSVVTLADERRIAARFHQTRPFVFTTHNECMIDSFVMLQFFMAHASFPRCVFGVRSSPFGAHCWLQRDDVVFNDTPDYVSKFTPILII